MHEASAKEIAEFAEKIEPEFFNVPFKKEEKYDKVERVLTQKDRKLKIKEQSEELVK